MNKLIIDIKGFAGTGKSSVAELISRIFEDIEVETNINDLDYPYDRNQVITLLDRLKYLKGKVDIEINVINLRK